MAKALQVPTEAIKNFDEEKAVNIISNHFTSHDDFTLNTIQLHCTFNPFNKLMDAFEENKKLHERLIETEREKVAMLERMMANTNPTNGQQ